MKVLVTGADGYIGAILAPLMLERGYEAFRLGIPKLDRLMVVRRRLQGGSFGLFHLRRCSGGSHVRCIN